MNRKQVLETAEKTVCGDRDGQYGSPEDSFSEIAKVWSWFLDKEITAKDVADMMILFKMARVKTGRFKDDNYVDVIGYAACGAEIGGRKPHKTVDDLAEIVKPKPKFKVGDKVTMQYWNEKICKKYGKYCFADIKEIDFVDPNGWCTVESMTGNYDLEDLEKWEEKNE